MGGFGFLPFIANVQNLSMTRGQPSDEPTDFEPYELLLTLIAQRYSSRILTIFDNIKCFNKVIMSFENNNAWATKVNDDDKVCLCRINIHIDIKP